MLIKTENHVYTQEALDLITNVVDPKIKELFEYLVTDKNCSVDAAKLLIIDSLMDVSLMYILHGQNEKK